MNNVAVFALPNSQLHRSFWSDFVSQDLLVSFGDYQNYLVMSIFKWDEAAK